MAETIKFIVHGTESATRAATPAGAVSREVPGAQVKRSVRLSRQRADGGEIVLEAVTDEDIVLLHIENGPVLTLHPESARDLLRSQARSTAAARGGEGTQPVQPRLQWADLRAGEAPEAAATQRSLLSDVVLSAIDIVKGTLQDKAAAWTADQVVRMADAQVVPGLYRLGETDFRRSLKDSGALPEAPASGAHGTVLVLVHGTLSNTFGTFRQLWEANPDVLRGIFRHYEGRVYGLEHETLGASPVANALMLARTLPKGTRLHLLTHSRGGLVAEVLARACTYKVAGMPALEAELARSFPGESHAGERRDLRDLILAVGERDIRVERVVRVACPARGTLLASGRLDAYVSLLKWAMQLGGVPVVPEVVGFLGAVAQHRTDPEKIPGIAAQMPDSPLIGWLHAVDDAIEGQLRVVAGDIEGDSLSGWIKTLASDGFYWTDNDFVVQTSSMYGGAPRRTEAIFMLSRSGKVSHFNYFRLEESALAIGDALTKSEPAGFAPIGPLSAAGKSSEGYRAAPRGDRPAVFVLPGILGSNLKVNGQRVWLGLHMLKGFHQLQYGADAVAPDGPVALSYEKLVRFLGATHDVIEFAYDWRLPLEQEAARLADAVDAALAAREASGQAVQLLAHSMGGLLARTMMLERPATWQRLAARAGARFVMLGTPNGGSWAPMQVLSGDDTFGNALVAFSSPLRDGEARQMMAQFPGFLQLQAGLRDSELMLHDARTWEKLADDDFRIVKASSTWHHLLRQVLAFKWGTPSQEVLEQAVRLRQRLDKAADALAAQPGLVALVVGHADFTPDGYEFTDGGLQYRESEEAGDGRVTFASARLPGVPAWRVQSEHGALANEESAFSAYLDLLLTGTTARLDRADTAATRDGEAATTPRYRLRRAARMAPGIRPDAVAMMPSNTSGRLVPIQEGAPPLQVCVVNGNLKFIRQPVLVGHYSSLALTGAEEVLNRLTGGSMAKAIGMGCYPSALGTHQIFLNTRQNDDNPLQLPRPESVIVVGLGGEGELKAARLAETVCQGVIAWAQRLVETSVGRPDNFGIAATLIGSGGANVTAGLAARSIAQGVGRANELLCAADWPHARQLDLIELYADRANEAWNSLNLLVAAEPGRYRVHDALVQGTGPQRRSLDSAYRGAGYDLISALGEGGNGRASAIVYSLNTRRAREDVRAQRTQLPLIDMMVKAAATAANADPQLGRTLFQLLVPPEVEPFLAGSTDMQIELNDRTASIPWELLDTSGGGRMRDDEKPWAIRVKLLRRLRTVSPQLAVNDARKDAHFLVIGEPLCDTAKYPPLPGARAEAARVADTFDAGGYRGRVRRLISGERGAPPIDAASVVGALLERDWRIVHIAGHGALPCENEDRGVVLSHDTYIGAVELGNMRTVPALVFINCCHLGAQPPGSLLGNAGLRGEDRPLFAASVAGALIGKGVRCVLVAGWAVEDHAAAEFARVFYEQLIRKARFIDAVAQARWAAYRLGGNTWAAYQCYGDPDWTLEPDDSARQEEDIPVHEHAAISSPPALVLALENIVTAARYEDVPRSRTQARVADLELRFGARWQGIGVVAEAFSMAWAEADRLDDAIRAARQARDASDSTASLGALEQLASLLTRRAWQAVRPLWRAHAESVQAGMAAAADAPSAGRIGKTGKGAGDAAGAPWKDRIASAYKALLAALGEQEIALDEAAALLGSLVLVKPTMQRVALLGACWKRIAMHRAVAGSAAGAQAALATMERHYVDAEAIGRATGHRTWFYPAMNRMIAQMVNSAGSGQARWDAEAARELEAELDARVRADPDFWNVAALTELKLYGAIAAGSLAAVIPEVAAEFTDLKRRVNATRGWNAILDQFDFVSTCMPAPPSVQDAQAFASVRALLAELVRS